MENGNLFMTDLVTNSFSLCIRLMPIIMHLIDNRDIYLTGFHFCFTYKHDPSEI